MVRWDRVCSAGSVYAVCMRACVSVCVFKPFYGSGFEIVSEATWTTWSSATLVYSFKDEDGSRVPPLLSMSPWASKKVILSWIPHDILAASSALLSVSREAHAWIVPFVLTTILSPSYPSSSTGRILLFFFFFFLILFFFLFWRNVSRNSGTSGRSSCGNPATGVRVARSIALSRWVVKEMGNPQIFGVLLYSLIYWVRKPKSGEEGHCQIRDSHRCVSEWINWLPGRWPAHDFSENCSYSLSPKCVDSFEFIQIWKRNYSGTLRTKGLSSGFFTSHEVI